MFKFDAAKQELIIRRLPNKEIQCTAKHSEWAKRAQTQSI